MEKIIDLGMHPFADSFIAEKDIAQSEPVYPLQCYLCKETGQVQVAYATKASERYNLHDYSYTSSNSTFARNHWKKYAADVLKNSNLSPHSTIIEIGSNDGFLCKEFQKKGHAVYGVDSSQYMSDLATRDGVRTHCGIFNYEESATVKELFGTPAMVVANNVFNHSNHPLSFARGVYNLLGDDGIFVYELPYWFSTVKTQKFDQIYHEHVSYFTVKSSFNLLARCGFEIIDVEEVDYHGGSIRVYARKLPISMVATKNDIVRDMIDEEEKFGLFDSAIYENFMKDIVDRRDNFLRKLYQIRVSGYPIIGVGAAAKGNTLLNFYNLDNTVLDYVTDASVYKQHKYTPLTRIPIVGDEIFEQYDRVCALILSWNISDIIKQKLKEINPRIEFMIPGGE
jgi:SAM-dependent methyltransferase